MRTTTPVDEAALVPVAANETSVYLRVGTSTIASGRRRAEKDVRGSRLLQYEIFFSLSPAGVELGQRGSSRDREG